MKVEGKIHRHEDLLCEQGLRLNKAFAEVKNPETRERLIEAAEGAARDEVNKDPH